MATPPQSFRGTIISRATGRPGGGRARWGRRGLIALLVCAAALLAWFWHPLLATARTGAAYGARMACSCRYVAGRTLGDCRKDFEPGMNAVLLSEDPRARRVTARFVLLASESATYREGWGCQLDAWPD